MIHDSTNVQSMPFHSIRRKLIVSCLSDRTVGFIQRNKVREQVGRQIIMIGASWLLYLLSGCKLMLIAIGPDDLLPLKYHPFWHVVGSGSRQAPKSLYHWNHCDFHPTARGRGHQRCQFIRIRGFRIYSWVMERRHRSHRRHLEKLGWVPFWFLLFAWCCCWCPTRP